MSTVGKLPGNGTWCAESVCGLFRGWGRTRRLAAFRMILHMDLNDQSNVGAADPAASK